MGYLGPPSLAWGEGRVLEQELVDLVLILEGACLEGRLVDCLEGEVWGQLGEVGGCSDRPHPPNRAEFWGAVPPGGSLEGVGWQVEGLQGADYFRPLKVSPVVI